MKIGLFYWFSILNKPNSIVMTGYALQLHTSEKMKMKSYMSEKSSLTMKYLQRLADLLTENYETKNCSYILVEKLTT